MPKFIEFRKSIVDIHEIKFIHEPILGYHPNGECPLQFSIMFRCGHSMLIQDAKNNPQAFKADYTTFLKKFKEHVPCS